MAALHLRPERSTGSSTDNGAGCGAAPAAYGTTNDRACGAAKKRSAKDIFLCRGLLYRHR
jgi:hypothetical protein